MTDVVVGGGGPTGLVLACGLLGAGVSVRVLDKASGPARTSRALGLQPRGAEVLERLGALGDLPERSVGIQWVSVQINGRHAADLRVGQRTKLVTRPGLLISQAEIEEQLRRRFSELGGEVEWATEVVGAEQDSDGVSVGLGDGTTVRAGWLVGCDGAHSRVRKAAGIGFPGVPLVERFLLTDVHADLPVPHHTVSVWLRGEDMIATFPLPGADLWRLMAPAPDGAILNSATPDNTSPDDTDDVLAVMTRLLTEHTGVPASAVRGVEWTSSFRFHRRLAGTYRQGRMLLAGDAAHIHSPFGGQGLNTGLGDAENLAWKLALVCTGRAAPTLLDTYQAERRPIAAEVLASTSGMTRLVLGDTPLARLVRDHVFVPLMNRPWVQRLIWEQASQLKIHYRKGPLAQHTRNPLVTGPRPGDRVPDLACRHLDGTNTRLHAELGARWVLLSRTDNPAVDDCARVVRKHLGEDATTVLVPARHCAMVDVLLVRPDAHLGWRGTPAADRLDRWLSSILRPAE